MSTNLPSFRVALGPQLADQPKGVQDAHKTQWNAITDIYQAIVALNNKVGTAKSTASSSSTGNVTNISETIIQPVNPTIGFVNNQSGVLAYTTLQSDYGSEIQFDDASPIAVTLSTLSTAPGIQLPWFTTINNLGAGTVTLTPVSPALIDGFTSLDVDGGMFAIVYFDGTNFTALLGSSGGGFPNPMTDEGDMIYQHTGVPDRLPIGSEYEIIVSTGTDPQWQPAGNVAVASLDGIQGGITLVAGSGIAIHDNTPVAGDITIEATGGGGASNDFSQVFMLMGA